jgi:site-specific recombinase XerD
MDPLSTSFLFSQFLDQRRYLKNVTPSTIEWYETAFKALQRAHATLDPAVTKTSLQQFVVSVRQRGVKPISCNTYIEALNAFCLWLHDEGHASERTELPLLKVEKRVIVTLTDEQMRTLLSTKPKRFDAWRLHALVCLLLDSGLRIEEALTLRRSDLDFDNLLVTVFGKGCKERRVPFSFELRKVLFRYEQVRAKQCPRCELFFFVAAGDQLGPAQQPSRTPHPSREARSADVWMAPTAPHVRDELPPPGRRHRAFVDGAGTFANHDDPTLSAPADGRPERQSSEGIDSEPARVNAGAAVDVQQQN